MRPQVTVVIVVACLALAVGCHSDPVATSRALAKRGDQYLAQKKTAEAIIEYRKAIAADPRNGEARLTLAKLYSDNGDFQNAFSESMRAADLLPQNIDAQLRAARILIASGQFDDAKARADQALKLQPRNMDALILKGNARRQD